MSLKQTSFPTPLSNQFLHKLEEEDEENGTTAEDVKRVEGGEIEELEKQDIEMSSTEEQIKSSEHTRDIQDDRATYILSPVRPSEKRRVPVTQNMSNKDKLVRPPCACSSYNPWKSTLPAPSPLLRCRVGLFRNGSLTTSTAWSKTRMGSHTSSPHRNQSPLRPFKRLLWSPDCWRKSPCRRQNC